MPRDEVINEERNDKILYPSNQPIISITDQGIS